MQFRKEVKMYLTPGWHFSRARYESFADCNGDGNGIFIPHFLFTYLNAVYITSVRGWDRPSAYICYINTLSNPKSIKKDILKNIWPAIAVTLSLRPFSVLIRWLAEYDCDSKILKTFNRKIQSWKQLFCKLGFLKYDDYKHSNNMVVKLVTPLRWGYTSNYLCFACIHVGDIIFHLAVVSVCCRAQGKNCICSHSCTDNVTQCDSLEEKSSTLLNFLCLFCNLFHLVHCLCMDNWLV